MLGILILLIISWLLPFFFEKKSILALGFLPIVKRLKQFFFGFLITAVLCVLVQFFEAWLKSATWVLYSKVTSGIILK